MNSKLKTISFNDVIVALLAQLSEREADVLAKRNALNNQEQYTLEEIGKEYNVTRERVRQIENEGIRKIKSIDNAQVQAPVKTIESIIGELLLQHGGAMSEDHLMEQLLDERNSDNERNAVDFLLTHVLAAQFERVDATGDFNAIWKIGSMSIDTYLTIANHLYKIISEQKRPITVTDLVNEIREHNLFDYIDKNSAKNDVMIEALLRMRKDINKNILSEWGIKNWKTITPKRMTDKAYLIMKREGRPLHFEEITDLINQACFDKKKACAATVHNELILDDKYVLVGRGLYALKEHGYEEGTVADIIAKLLREQSPMTKDEIIDQVLKQRMVQKTTVTLALMKKDRFARNESGAYTLVA